MHLKRLVLYVMMVLLSVIFFAGLVTASSPFDSGSGTEEDPYLIGTAEQLDSIRGESYLDKHYRLIANIDLDGEDWEPIGDYSNRFTGSFDGNGYIIYNLTINSPGVSRQGLFGGLQDATINNVTLSNASVTGYDDTGAIAGYAQGSAFENVHVSGEVAGSRNVTGGMVGYLSGGNVHYCSFNGLVTGQEGYTGGLIGRATSNATIYYSYSLGSVEGKSPVGGLVGMLQDNNTLLYESYSRAAVSGLAETGGLVGYLSSSRILRSFSTGFVNVPDAAPDIGGLLGKRVGGSVNYCYWDTEASGQTSSAAGTGKTTAEMQQREIYENWNFYTLWQIDEGNSYPFFQDLSVYDKPQTVNLVDLAGDGSVDNPYIITSIDELNAIRQDLTAHYTLNENLDLSATVAWNYGFGWEPLGDSATKFSGSFDGDGYEISNLTTNRPMTNYQGLFGSTDGAEISNITLVNVSMQGRQYTGSLVGLAGNTAIGNVHVIGEVTGNSNDSGGMVGNLEGTLYYSSFNGTVRGQNNTGGLVGYTAAGAAIYYSYSLGSVTGVSEIGGLVGNHYKATIADSYSRSSVEGDNRVGGLVGYSSGTISGHAYIYNSYSSGEVADTGTNVGGLIGEQNSRSTVENCFWDTETSGQTSSAAGTGKTTAEMQQEATYANWDFESDPAVWSIVEDTDYPNLVQTARSIALIPDMHLHGGAEIIGESFQIVSNTDWTAISNQDWLIISNGSTGGNNGAVIYNLEANSSTKPREGTITVSGSGIERTFTVKQLGSDPVFTDVSEDHPFFEEIEALVASGIANGWPDGTFRPTLTVTRMAMAAFLFRAFELEDPGVTEPSFSDVDADHPFFVEIEAIAAAGISTGWPDGTFRPDNPVTRQAMAAFLFRVLALEDPGVSEPTFSDVPDDHTYFTEIEALALTGITTGWPDGTFRPTQEVTRQAMAAFLIRALEQ